MDRYETNQKGTSPALSAILNKFSEMPRSSFDETRTKDLDVPFYGIVPLECFQMFPNSEGYLRYDIKALTKNPTISRMFSNANIELRTYVCKNSDLWEGWNNFLTRGRSGKITKRIPYLIFNKSNGIVSELPYNPAHYLNIAPATVYNTDLSFSNNTGFHNTSSESNFAFTDLVRSASFGTKSFQSYFQGVSALPFVMYTKIAKEYQNPNLLQNNPNWYPENENHDTILSYGCSSAACSAYGKETTFFGDYIGTTGYNYDEQQPTDDEHSMPWLNILYFKQRKGDYFTTASPFPDLLRGDVPTMENLAGQIDFTNAFYKSASGYLDFYRYIGLGKLRSSLGGTWLGVLSAEAGQRTSIQGPAPSDNFGVNSGTYELGPGQSQLITHLTDNDQDTKDLLEVLNRATVKNVTFSLNQWRKLATMTVFRERMARTDGSYNQMIMAQFKHNPKWHEHSVKYCGGSSQPLVFSEVVQQSESGTTPLGTTAGRAFSDSTSREIKISVDDFSIMMTVLCITPNTVYSQGIDRMWSELDQADQYFPILNNLEPQAIKNKELFVDGDPAIDENVFAYQERFSHFKSRQNQVSGLMALPVSKVGKVGTYLFNRLFSQTPNFNWDFVQGKTTDNENLCFASTEQAPFLLHVSSSFKYVAPMPAVSQASDVGLSY